MTRLVLACTVGGSPAPVVSAIRMARPEHVLFVVTGADGGRPGSDAEVPGIVAATGLAPHAWEQLVVPPDDPDTAYARLAEALRGLRTRFAQARLLADYTGGTKSMSAALLAAALEQPGCDIQLMAGQRGDLRAVTHGTERPFRVNPGWLEAGRAAARHRAAWERFGYAEAEAGFAALLDELETDQDAPPASLQRLRDLRDLSGGFAAWDRFQHGAARERLQGLRERHDAFLVGYLEQLDLLCSATPRGEGARVADLLLNARRRAARRQYDDAIARLYRLIEWTQQWPLRTRHGVDTGKVLWDALPPAAVGRLPERVRGKAQLGLIDGLRLLAALEPDGAAASFLVRPWPGDRKRTHENRLRDMLDARNFSILAHGTQPIDTRNWERFYDFIEAAFVPLLLRPELARAGLSAEPAQLPQAPPDQL